MPSKSRNADPGRSLYKALLIAAAVVIAVDQTTKAAALSRLQDGEYVVIEGVLSFRLAFNSGGAFGLLQGFPELFLVASLVAAVLILVWARTIGEPSWAIPLGMVLGGGLGNVADRIFRDTGGRVVDFIDLKMWPTFNVADASIVTGIGLILLLGARSERSHRDAPPDDDAGGLGRTPDDAGGLGRTPDDAGGLGRTPDDAGGLGRTPDER